jgi:hypothetical protein
MTPSDRQFLEDAGKFGEWRGEIIDCSRVPLSERDHWRFHRLVSAILDYIRRRRGDLDTRALYQLVCLERARLPPAGELAMLIDDATDVISEVVHSLNTGRIGEYIEAACPSLRKSGPEAERKPVKVGAKAKPAGTEKKGKKSQICVGIYMAALAKGEVPPTDSEIAAMVGCDRITAYRAIRPLEKQRLESAQAGAENGPKKRRGSKSIRNKKRA